MCFLKIRRVADDLISEGSELYSVRVAYSNAQPPNLLVCMQGTTRRFWSDDRSNLVGAYGWRRSQM